MRSHSQQTADEGEGSFVSETIEAATDTAGDAAAGRGGTTRSGALSTLRLPELQALAAELGVPRTSTMRKGDLVTAIREHRAGSADSSGSRGAAGKDTAKDAAPKDTAPKDTAPTTRTAPGDGHRTESQESAPKQDASERDGADGRDERREGRGQERPGASDRRNGDRNGRQGADRSGGESPDERAARAAEAARSVTVDGRRPRHTERDEEGRDGSPDGDDADGGSRESRSNGGQGRDQDGQQAQHGQRNQQGNRNQGRQGGQQGRQDDDDQGGGGRRRRGRYRDRDRNKRRGRPNDLAGYEDVEISEDDVLLPVAGILDIKDNYAFVRTSGYLPGDSDVYVSMNQVKKNGMRKGDAIVGAVRQPREGEQPQGRGAKVNALVRLDSINGMAPEESKSRPDFGKLTPLYPQERLRLETEPNVLTTRVIDLVAPIGKGQRGLIVSPPKAGKTLVLQAIANAITTNNPEVHLMVVLVDERPEEVTDMQRTVKGEVIASTFDRPAEDHTTVAELAIERAKRLVEQGQD